MFKIRGFFWRATVVFFAIFLWAAVVAAVSPAPDQVTLTWTGDPKTTQTISWRTDASVTAGQVRFGADSKNAEGGSQLWLVPAQTKVLETADGEINLHSATLTGLTSGMQYRYQVGDGSIWSDIYTFKTEPQKNESFNFLVFGDSQSMDYGIWRDTLQAAVGKNPDAAFFVNMGDLVDNGQDYNEWERWFSASTGVIERIPVMPLTGNHECYTPERRFSRPIFFTTQFALPENGPEEMKRQVYSFNYGDVHFVMLDSQEGEQSQFIPDMLELQRQWLEADLAATDKKWIIVFIHRPLFGNKPNGINENLRRMFVGVFDQYQVNVVFTAHDHVYARTKPMYNNEDEIVQVPVQGAIHVPTGRTGSKTYANVSGKEWNVFFHNPEEEPMYLTVNSSGDILSVKAMGLSGQLIDEWAIEKSPSKPGK
jgi:hypothetical protein